MAINVADNRANITPGWAAIVTGHKFDLAYWAMALKSPFDPWVEIMESGGRELHLLRSSSFERLVEARDVRATATALIEQLNAAHSIIVGAEPLSLEGVNRVDDDGKVHQYLFAETGHFRMRTSLTVTLTHFDAEGKLVVPDEPPAPSIGQKWIAAGEANDDIADMLIFASRSDSWYDIYKAYELARIIAGKRRLPGLLGSSANECEAMRVTANFYRHARVNRIPPRFTTLEEAKPLLALVVKTVLDDAVR